MNLVPAALRGTSRRFAEGAYLDRTVVAFSVALVSALWAFVAYSLDSNRQNAISRVEAANSNLARVFEAHAGGALRDLDQALANIKRQYERKGGQFDLAQYVRDAGLDVEPVNYVYISGRDGEIVISSPPVAAMNIRDREFFQQHAGNDADTLHLGKPAPEMATGKVSIPLTRRINARNGSFAGIVGIALDPSYLSGIYSQIDLGSGGVVTLLGRDGVVRARQSGAGLSSGQNVGGNDLLTRRINLSATGSYTATSALDGITRIFSYRAMRDYPLVILVGTAEETALADFNERKEVYLIGAVIVSALLLAFALLSVTQIGRQSRLNNQLLDAREALQRSEEHFRAVFDHAAVGMGRATPDGQWLQCNPKLAQILGYSQKELESLSVWQITDPQDVGATRQYLRRVRNGTGAGAPLEKRMVRKDGAKIWTELTVTHVAAVSDQSEYSIGVVTDISARKAAEAEAAQLHRELEDRVSRRTAELAEANKRLESFSYSVSHDLRTPLRAISGFAQILARRHRDSLDEQGRHYMDNIVRASAQMGRLIEDLLNYSRLGRKEIRLEPVEVGTVVADVIRHVMPRLTELGASVRVAAPLPPVIGDTTLLTQIFLNLVDNALTYQRKGMEPAIVVSAVVRDGQVTVAVADNGIGIASEHFERIFGVFQRLHNDDVYPGTGIGLATVKRAVDLLGGKVWLEWDPLESTCRHASLSIL